MMELNVFYVIKFSIVEIMEFIYLNKNNKKKKTKNKR